MDPGFRRRILIAPAPGAVTGELEDDWHRMAVTLRHVNGVIQAVESEMKRRPWTTCPGAMQQLRDTFEGVALADVCRRGEKTSNCTHLYDLAVFAAAHAGEALPVAYDIVVPDAATTEVPRTARLWRDGAPLLAWTLEGGRITAPGELAGRKLSELGDWIAVQDKATAEAARILRWASIMAAGRSMDIPAGMSATTFPPGACYTFQPEAARRGVRVADAHWDFSAGPLAPLADRPDAFANAAA